MNDGAKPLIRPASASSNAPLSRSSRARSVSAATLFLGLSILAGCGRSGDGVAEQASSAESPDSTKVKPPPTTARATTSTTRQLTYVIQSGDSLSIIAQRFGVSTQQLADFNAIADVHAIKVGQELSVPPASIAPESETESATTTSTPADGSTSSSSNS